MEIRNSAMEGMVDMTSAFWKNRKVLVTGSEGFVGSNITRRLVLYGANVTGLDIKVNRKKTILTQDDYKRINVVKGNVSNLSLIDEVIGLRRIEVVFHLAAEAIVGKCVSNPLRTFSSNIKGTWNVLESCRKSKSVKTVIVASSDKAYGCCEKLPYTEDTPLAGSHPYDSSKSCADLIAYTYFRTYGLPVCITRCGNIYGPGDFNFSRIVPDVIRSAIKSRTLAIRSNGEFTRDYIYVEDIVSGYLKLAEEMRDSSLFGEAFNFSNEKPVSVLNLVKTICKLLGQKPDYEVLNQAGHEIRHQYLCSGKAKKKLGWKPQYDLQEALKKTVNWYREYL